MPPDAARIAERHVPGKGKLEFTRLGGGLVNETYRVGRDGISYALPVAVSHAGGLGFDRTWEARVLQRAGCADLAPAVEYVDPERGILLTRWVDGRQWDGAAVRDPLNIARIADLLHRIHAVPLPTPAREMN